MCVFVSTYWVNLYEGAVLVLIGRKALNVVQQHRIGIIEVRLGDEDWRV